jgi:hypothetical protein
VPVNERALRLYGRLAGSFRFGSWFAYSRHKSRFRWIGVHSI